MRGNEEGLDTLGKGFPLNKPHPQVQNGDCSRE